MTNISLRGAVDLHVHSSPDVRPRFADSYESAEIAVAAAMAGIALKNHNYGTAPITALLQPRLPGIRLFSYLVMNYSAGGLSREVVRTALDLGTDIVSFPTLDAAHHLATSGKDSAAGVQIAAQGELLPAAKRIIEDVSAADRVIATGHSSAHESLLIARYAHAVGGRRVLLTHVTSRRISMPLEMQLEAASLGARIEHAYESTRPHMEHPATVEEVAAQVAKVGPENCVLTTDFGQVNNPSFTDGLAAFAAEIAACGIAEISVQKMISDQPWLLVAR